jgi:pimeloyl-ACP methyl ester carboxylesterase
MNAGSFPAESRQIVWQIDGHAVALGLTEAGHGPPVLLLPALSSISTRQEMYPLMMHLKDHFHVVTIDWPGFGTLPKPRIDWTPDVLSRFLDWVLREVVTAPRSIVAAGHAATYVLYHGAGDPAFQPRLVLIAPTWRGPLPTMMGGDRHWFGRIRSAIDLPVLGPALYAINLSGPVMRMMVKGHVYSNPAFLSGERRSGKAAVAKAHGARHASVRFVTGGLDRVRSRHAFLDLMELVPKPILLIYGEETPPKSRTEMEAASRMPGVETLRLPRGKLSVHEEFPERIAPDILAFLRRE